MNQHLKTSLEELADAEYADAPPTTIDIGRARADGRRRIATARLAPIGGGLAVVAACALVVNGLGGTSPAGRPESVSAAAGDLNAGTDPIAEVASFGYVPEGYEVAVHASGSGSNYVSLQTKLQVPSENPRYLNPSHIDLTPSTTEPHALASETKTSVKVTGSPKAYILHSTDVSGQPARYPDSLVWQTASGSWFTLDAFDQPHGVQLRATLIKIADSMTVKNSGLPMPIHVDGVPKSAQLGSAELNDPIVVGQNPPGVSARLTFGDGESRYISFEILVMTVGWTDPQSGKSAPPAGTDACKDSEGLHICVMDDHAGINGVNPLDSVGGAKGLLDRITSLGTDRSNWTTHVLN